MYHLGYKLIKATTGKHIVANRPHYHTMIVGEFEPNQVYEVDTPFGKKKVMKKKVYKTLNKSISQIIKTLGYTYDVKVSFKYSNGIGKNDIEYDETALQYPFKEYTEFSKVPLSLQVGYSVEELKSMWKLAKTEWERKLARDRVKEQREKNENDKKLQFKEYLISKVGNDGTCSNALFRTESYEFKIKTVIRHSLIYYKENGIKFRFNSLKDEAINFLYHHNFLTEAEIINKIYI